MKKTYNFECIAYVKLKGTVNAYDEDDARQKVEMIEDLENEEYEIVEVVDIDNVIEEEQE